MAIENVVAHQPDPSNQNSESGLTMWEALVQVASERYEELLAAERQQKLLMETVEQSQVRQQTTQPATLIRSAELSIAVNVTVVGEELEDEEPNRLVIDESVTELAQPTEPSKPMEFQAITPNGVVQPQVRQIIVPTDQPCYSSSSSNSSINSSTGSGNHMLSPQALSDTGESSHLASGVRPIRHPRRMSQVSFDRFTPYPIPSSYNKNMARKFPGAENRTPEQQAVRERNTVAARQSRAKMRMMDEMLHQEANNERTHNRYMKERMAGLFMYANILREQIGLQEADFIEEFDRVKQDYVPGPIRSHHVRARSRGEGQAEHQVPQQGQQSGQVEVGEIEGTPSSPSDVNINQTNQKSNISIATSDTDSVPELENTVLDLSLKNKHV